MKEEVKKTFSNINNNFLIDVTSLFFPYFVSFFVVVVSVVDGGVVVIAAAAAAFPIRHRVARVIAIPFAIVYCLIAHTNSKALVGRGMCERARSAEYSHIEREMREAQWKNIHFIWSCSGCNSQSCLVSEFMREGFRIDAASCVLCMVMCKLYLYFCDV